MSRSKTEILANLDEFTRAYIECALWSFTDWSDESGGDPLDQNYSEYDIALPTLREMVRECREFQRYHAADLAAYYAAGRTEGDAGHDFWLTRNGRGAGFWDRGLSEASRPYGSVDLYVARGKVHS